MNKFYLMLLLAVVASLAACKTLSSVGKADKKFAQGEYNDAIRLYENALKNTKEPGPVNFKLAESYRLSNRIMQAEPYYKAALDAGVKKEEGIFYYGVALKANTKYNEASTQFARYAQAGTNKTLVARAKLEVANMNAVPGILNAKTYNELKPLDQLNTNAAEFAPTMLNGELYFASSRDGKLYHGNGEGFNDIFALRYDNPAELAGGLVRKMGSPINTSEAHEAAVTFSKDGTTMIFARSNTGSRKGTLNVDLYVSRFKGSWSEPRLLSINSKDAWDSSPALSPDGKTLYFSSDRKGGQGGNDIYRSNLDDQGRFSTPENLGPEINTPGNENFPFVAEDGTLYISSDGHPGLGSLDIFRIEKNKPVNLGVPINSNADDFAPYMLSNESGYFSSNRAGGKGSDDIYFFKKAKPKLVNFYVDVTVRELLPNTTNYKPMSRIRVELQDTKGVAVDQAFTNPDGKLSFKLDTAKAYSLLAENPGYFAARQAVSTIGKTPPQASLTQPETDIRLTANLVLTRIIKDKPIVVENIYYDLDKADIRPDAALELDKLVQTLIDNPKITIELSSHTDVRGKDAYNLDLSQRRAQSAVDYIISKGIAANRVTAKGYGETRLIVKNATTEEQHQRNRRTQFKVTKIAQ
jgi:outer membrane protein OmpA-like peptidoglycan-associated protein